MNDVELEGAILALVQSPDYKPSKPRVIAQRLDLPKDEAPAVRKAVKRLVAQGKVAYGSSHLVRPVNEPSPDKPKTKKQPAEPKSNRIVGLFRRNSAGFGFVRPTSTASEGEELQDVYIAAEDSGDAATGDLVAVKVKRQRGEPGKGPRGEIVEIIQRETHRFVGTYFEARGSAYVQVDGPLFTKPILVGDPETHNVEPNDKVVIEMVRFPSHLHKGEGVIVEVLGPRGKPGVDTLSVIREYDLPEEFPKEVLEDARRQAERFDESIPPGRRDATDEVIVTIDPIDARDFDDAISLVRPDNGHWLLGVHIADVSHFVPPKSELDREAYERATSVYLPDRVIPMLPELISNSLASLQPNKVRYTKSAYIEFTAEGQRVGTELFSAAIKSHKRLTYEQVDEFLADPEPFRKKWGAAVFDLLGRMRTLAAILRQRRMKRGALELTMPEVKVDLDKQGRVAGAHVVENTESHRIIEEFMLAANEAVADMLQEKEIAFLRRIHLPPKPHKLRALGEFVEELGLPLDDVESRFALQDLLRDVVGRPEQHAVNYALLRSMQRAIYSPQEEGHYALASDCYCHFTSPIRRYPDLTVHRLVQAVLEGKQPKQHEGELFIVGENCSEREQRAEQAERELVKLKLLLYMSQRIGEEMDAVITGVESFGLFAQGTKLPAEGLIHVDSLVDDYYQFDRAAHTLSGRRSGNTFRLGDMVRVAVARVDLERRELDFRLIHREKRPEPPARDGRHRRGRRSDRDDRSPRGRKAKDKGQQNQAKPPRKKKAKRRRR